MNKVPEGWKSTQIGEVAHFKSGGTPSKSRSDFWGGEYPWVSGKDLKQHYLTTSIDTLAEEGFSNANKAPEGSSLILVRGMTLLKDFPVGYATRELSFNQDIKALVPVKGIDGLYLSYLLVANKNLIQQLVSTAGHGTGRLDTESIKSFPVNIPAETHEQQKIAKILSTWDKATSTTEQLISNSQQQKKSLMKKLLTGTIRFKEFIEPWMQVKLSDVSTMNSGGTPLSSVAKYYDGDIPWVSIADMTKHGKWISKTQKNITTLGLENSAARLYPKYTILYAMYASIGECSIANTELASSQAILGIQTAKELNYLYLYYYLSSLKEKIKLQGQQGTQANLNAGMVKAFELKLPPLTEQQKIAQVLTAADREIELLQQKLAGLKQEKQALMQQLLTGKRRVVV